MAALRADVMELVPQTGDRLSHLALDCLELLLEVDIVCLISHDQHGLLHRVLILHEVLLLHHYVLVVRVVLLHHLHLFLEVLVVEVVLGVLVVRSVCLRICPAFSSILVTLLICPLLFRAWLHLLHQLFLLKFDAAVLNVVLELLQHVFIDLFQQALVDEVLTIVSQLLNHLVRLRICQHLRKLFN